MKILMHICCANCAIYPIKSLKHRGMDVFGLWFNPNIHPFTEYRLRMKSVEMLKDKVSIDISFVDDYGLIDFVRNVAFNESSRCKYCYNVRLEETAKTAKKYSINVITTSLLISPYQDIQSIYEIGCAVALRYNMEFYMEDFRSAFLQGKKLGRDLGFYQQRYCGCIYSEMERYGRS